MENKERFLPQLAVMCQLVSFQGSGDQSLSASCGGELDLFSLV